MLRRSLIGLVMVLAAACSSDSEETGVNAAGADAGTEASGGDDTSVTGDTVPGDDAAVDNTDGTDTTDSTDGTDSTDATDSTDSTDPETADDILAADLKSLREEEKLARDVYLTLHEKWGLPIFENIASSEQRHTDAVKDQLARFGLADPVEDDTVGAFTAEAFQDLFTDLVASGQPSEVAALMVGATIEDLDIHDIQVMRPHTDDAEVLAMYDSLECGSRNHMRSFMSQLEQKGGSYDAQFLSADAIAEILAGASEECGGEDGNGGGGKGKGGGGGGGGGGGK